MSKNLKRITLFKDDHPCTMDKRNWGTGITVEEKGRQTLATGKDHTVPGAPPQAGSDQCLGTEIRRGRLQYYFRIILAF